MHHTADGRLAELAYLLTVDGFQWFRARCDRVKPRNPLQRPEESVLLERVRLHEEISALRAELISASAYFKLADDKIGFVFDGHLDGAGPEGGYSILKFWEATADAKPDWFSFAKTAWILLQIPASESAAERGFSIFQALRRRRRSGAKEALVAAELRVRLEHVCDRDLEQQTKDWEKARAEVLKHARSRE
jgi:hypothetical protein